MVESTHYDGPKDSNFSSSLLPPLSQGQITSLPRVRKIWKVEFLKQASVKLHCLLQLPELRTDTTDFNNELFTPPSSTITITQQGLTKTFRWAE
jgi:hypothetical protein